MRNRLAGTERGDGARKVLRSGFALALVASTALVAVPAIAAPARTIDPLAGGSGGNGAGGNTGGIGGQASEEGPASRGGGVPALPSRAAVAVAVAIPVGPAERTD